MAPHIWHASTTCSLGPRLYPLRVAPISSTSPWNLYGSLRADFARLHLCTAPCVPTPLDPSCCRVPAQARWRSLQNEHIQKDSSHKRKNTASKERQKRWAAPTMERVESKHGAVHRTNHSILLHLTLYGAIDRTDQALPSTLPLCSDIQLFRRSLQLSHSDTLPTLNPPHRCRRGRRSRGPGPWKRRSPTEARSYAADCEKRTPRTEQTTTRSRRSQGCPSLFDARALA